MLARTIATVVAIALGTVGAATLTGCSPPGGDGRRDAVMVRTCADLLRRRGVDREPPTATEIAAAFESAQHGGRGYNTIQPFLRACPLRG